MDKNRQANHRDDQKAGHAKLGGHFRVVSLATSVSRIAGFVRDQLNAAVFGAGLVSDAYFSALRIPSLFRELFAEGALSSAFVPTLSKSLQKEKAQKTWDLISQVFTLLLLVTGTVMAAGILLAPWVVHLVAPGFAEEPAKFDLTVKLTQMLFPFLLFVSMAALWMGCLNAHERFGIPAFAPVMMNLSLIATGLVLLFWPSLRDSKDDFQKMYIWTAATTVGFALQWLIQVPFAKGLGGRIRLLWPPSHPGVKEMLWLIGPSLVTLSVTQIAFVLNQIFASFLQTGSITCLNYGNRLMQLPYGVFGVSIATVVFPLMSRQAASGNKTGFQDTLRKSVEAAAFITLPSMVGLCIVSLPICQLAFMHGNFGAEATKLVAEVTCLYVLGLFAHAGIKILAQSFYPLRHPKWPFWGAVMNMSVTALLNLSAILFLTDQHQQFLALPMATTLGAFGNFLFLVWGLRRYGVKLSGDGMGMEFLKILAATSVMGIFTAAALAVLQRLELPFHLFWEVFVPIGLGVGVYFLLAKFFACKSLLWVTSRGKRG